MSYSKTARLGALVLAATALAPAGSAFAQELDDETPETDTFCTDYQDRYDAMVRLNERIVSRYEKATTATPGNSATAGADRGPVTRGKSADRRPEASGAANGMSRKAAALLSLQNRLAARSSELAERVSDECGETITPIDPISPILPT